MAREAHVIVIEQRISADPTLLSTTQLVYGMPKTGAPFGDKLAAETYAQILRQRLADAGISRTRVKVHKLFASSADAMVETWRQ